jgi:hypothetical protein
MTWDSSPAWTLKPLSHFTIELSLFAASQRNKDWRRGMGLVTYSRLVILFETLDQRLRYRVLMLKTQAPRTLRGNLLPLAQA